MVPSLTWLSPVHSIRVKRWAEYWLLRGCVPTEENWRLPGWGRAGGCRAPVAPGEVSCRTQPPGGRIPPYSCWRNTLEKYMRNTPAAQFPPLLKNSQNSLRVWLNCQPIGTKQYIVIKLLDSGDFWCKIVKTEMETLVTFWYESVRVD